MEIKLVTLGDVAVGKTCLLERWMSDYFRSSLNSTCGVALQKHLTTIDGKEFLAAIWDTAGHDQFNSMTRMYCRGAAGALIVFAVTDRETFDHLPRWVALLRESCDDAVPIVIAANKIDSDSCVEDHEIMGFCEQIGLTKDSYFYTSAATGENVTDALVSLMRRASLYVTKEEEAHVDRSGQLCELATSREQQCC
jgi:small GTP-binding protein